MSEFVISDPTTFRTAGVNADGRLKTHTAMETLMAYQSRVHAAAYEFHPPRFSLTNNVDMPLIWLKNISNENNFHIESLRIGSNGGDTTPHDKAIIVRTYLAADEPTTDVTTGQFGASDVPHTLNLASTRDAEIDFKFWDGTGTDGMTISDVAYTTGQKGNQINCGFYAQGQTEWRFRGSLILSPGSIMMLTAEIEQDTDSGQVIVVVSGFFLPEPEKV